MPRDGWWAGCLGGCAAWSQALWHWSQLPRPVQASAVAHSDMGCGSGCGKASGCGIPVPVLSARSAGVPVLVASPQLSLAECSPETCASEVAPSPSSGSPAPSQRGLFAGLVRWAEACGCGAQALGCGVRGRSQRAGVPWRGRAPSEVQCQISPGPTCTRRAQMGRRRAQGQRPSVHRNCPWCCLSGGHFRG